MELQEIERVLSEIEDELYDQLETVKRGTLLDYRLAAKQDMIPVVRARLKARWQ